MKTQLLFFILFASTFCNGQERFNNFIFENGELVWQKVFQLDSIEFDVIDYFATSGIFQNFMQDSGMIAGDIRSVDILYREAGYRMGNIPIYSSRSFIFGYTVIESREGRYRVTMSRLTLEQTFTDPLNEKGEYTPLMDYAYMERLKKFRNGFIDPVAIILDYTFSNVFRVKVKKDDEW